MKEFKLKPVHKYTDDELIEKAKEARKLQEQAAASPRPCAVIDGATYELTRRCDDHLSLFFGL